MIKAIAEDSNIKMPSFFGYIFKYSIPILIPILIIYGCIFIKNKICKRLKPSFLITISQIYLIVGDINLRFILSFIFLFVPWVFLSGFLDAFHLFGRYLCFTNSSLDRYILYLIFENLLLSDFLKFVSL